jgi:hypothetical protein
MRRWSGRVKETTFTRDEVKNYMKTLQNTALLPDITF